MPAIGITAKEARRQRAQTQRELRADLIAKDRARLAELRSQIKAARAKKKASLRTVTEVCQAGRAEVRERARAIRAAAREKAKQQIELEREAARTSCSTKRATTREKGVRAIAQAREAAERARLDIRLVGRAHKTGAQLMGTRGGAGAGGRRAAELRGESDDEVRANLPDELVPVFNRVRRTIHESARRTRTEAFLEWAAEHPEQVWEIREADVARDLARLEREERALSHAVKNGRHKLRGPALAAALEAVPF